MTSKRDEKLDLIELMLTSWLVALRVQTDWLAALRRSQSAQIIPFPKKFRRRQRT